MWGCGGGVCGCARGWDVWGVWGVGCMCVSTYLKSSLFTLYKTLTHQFGGNGHV